MFRGLKNALLLGSMIKNPDQHKRLPLPLKPAALLPPPTNKAPREREAFQIKNISYYLRWYSGEPMMMPTT